MIPAEFRPISGIPEKNRRKKSQWISMESSGTVYPQQANLNNSFKNDISQFTQNGIFKSRLKIKFSNRLSENDFSVKEFLIFILSCWCQSSAANSYRFNGSLHALRLLLMLLLLFNAILTGHRTVQLWFAIERRFHAILATVTAIG
jgi:hypothetical protein